MNLTEEEEYYERMKDGIRERDSEMDNLCDKRKLYEGSQTRLQEEANIDTTFVEALLAIIKKEPKMYWMIFQLFQSKLIRILATMTDLKEDLRVVLLGGHHQES